MKQRIQWKISERETTWQKSKVKTFTLNMWQLCRQNWIQDNERIDKRHWRELIDLCRDHPTVLQTCVETTPRYTRIVSRLPHGTPDLCRNYPTSRQTYIGTTPRYVRLVSRLPPIRKTCVETTPCLWVSSVRSSSTSRNLSDKNAGNKSAITIIILIWWGK